MSDYQDQYLGTNTMRQLISDNNLLLPVISRFGISFGFGDRTVEDVCRAECVDTDTFLTVCNFLSGKRFDATAISLPSLMGYLRHAHSSFLEVTLPHIRHHLIDATAGTMAQGEISILLIKFFDDYVAEVRHHMDYENETVFSYVDGLLHGTVSDCGFNISRFSLNHSHTATKISELKDLFIYHLVARNDRLNAALFDIIICERDLMSHFDVESRLFIPAVERLEHTLSEDNAGGEPTSGEEEDSQQSQLSALSEREKDIVRCVARGMSNKEIADSLFISAHTVATHRKNISAKLDIHSSAGLTIFAILHHIVELDDVNPQ